MKYLINDREQSVISVGSPGSIERVKVQYPRLIDRLNSLYFSAYESPGKAVDEAIEIIRREGITSEMETISLLQASYYGDEPQGSVTDLVIGLTGENSGT